MRLFIYIAVALLLSGCATLERAALPESGLLDQNWSKAATTETVEVNQTIWDAFLARYVRTDADGINRVNYSAVTKTNHAQLRGYIASLEQIDPKSLSRDQQLAFWINLYNAKTVDIVLSEYPVDSILDINDGILPTGPWKRKVVRVDSRELSLNDIEHGIVRPVFDDARIHYALNCAASGCPNLKSSAWRAETLEEDLDAAEQAYVNDPRGIRFDENGRLTLSKIYTWFREDFGDDEEELLEELSAVVRPELESQLAGRTSVDRYEYDWSLNDVKNGVFPQ